jgi:hypothetical protein
MGRKSGNLLRMRGNRTDAPAGAAQVTNTDGHQDRCSSAQLPRRQQVAQYPEPDIFKRLLSQGIDSKE